MPDLAVGGSPRTLSYTSTERRLGVNPNVNALRPRLCIVFTARYIYCPIVLSLPPRGYLPKGWIHKISANNYIISCPSLAYLYTLIIMSPLHHIISLRTTHRYFHIFKVSIPLDQPSLFEVQGSLTEHEARYARCVRRRTSLAQCRPQSSINAQD